MRSERLDQLLDTFASLRIAVVGDFFLDKYLVVDPSLGEPSIETGLEAHQVVGKRLSPGAAGTVTSNLSALGVGTIHAVGIIGQDGEGYDLKHGLRERRVTTDYLLESADRFTPTYTKPMAIQPDGSEIEMNRQDIKNRSATPPELEASVIETLRSVARDVDGVIVLDQVTDRNFGVATDRVREEIASLASQYPDVVFFGDARALIGEFRNILIKPNQFEAVRAILPDYEGNAPPDFARECGEELARRTGKPLFVTLGQDGILVYDGSEWTRVPTIRVSPPIDIVGAGDSTTAG
ncbi:MAG: PfkB family carbohydrate kinase, partial [Candidatus Poribacteria bacterium]|nr:PfkB family carbohydrate kinase [Candidatus Poribacteria bacterium]